MFPSVAGAASTFGLRHSCSSDTRNPRQAFRVSHLDRAAQSPPRSELVLTNSDKEGALFTPRYRLLSTIGQGGMGKVSKALDRLTGQVVALKQVRLRLYSLESHKAPGDTLLPSTDSTHPPRQSAGLEAVKTRPFRQLENTATTQTEQRLALAQEFCILASLCHPNIISVLDYGFDQAGRPFFTMELLENALPLQAIATDAPPGQRGALVCQILMALWYLHRHGIIHRDLTLRFFPSLNSKDISAGERGRSAAQRCRPTARSVP